MFKGEEATVDDNYNKLEQQDYNKHKDHDEELVKMNLATRKGESQPISIFDNLPVELRQALINLS